MKPFEPKWDYQALALAEIEIAEKLMVRQPRAATVKEYAQAMRAGAAFPEVDVARIGKRLVLVDGMHRLNAALQADRPMIAARVARMTWAQAGSYAAVANIGHGRPLGTREAKGRALELFLRDPANDNLSLREVSKALGGLVAPGTVKNYRDKVLGKLRGSDGHTLGDDFAAIDEAREKKIAEQALRQLEGLEALYGRLSDASQRYRFMMAVRTAVDRMEAAGNTAPSDIDLGVIALGI